MLYKGCNIVRHFVFAALLLSILGPHFAYSQADPVVKAPETIDETREKAVNISENILGVIPGVISRIWRQEAVPVWRRMGEWVKTEIWEKRRPLIEQELEKEKEELKEDIQRASENAGTSVWERFKNLFRK